ncbi:hypothetical protein FA13DRAFT_96858 [Coprinellus micaceus]|uniref:Uncharacterized protein n=1 Tax=Coprinellus micaceus TaxID=71717 RepID=A0A4Y7SIY3_COPMI|nr:hypothetical protein FA13DRAFT_96858 [Coprinellus micaceus]
MNGSWRLHKWGGQGIYILVEDTPNGIFSRLFELSPTPKDNVSQTCPRQPTKRSPWRSTGMPVPTMNGFTPATASRTTPASLATRSRSPTTAIRSDTPCASLPNRRVASSTSSRIPTATSTPRRLLALVTTSWIRSRLRQSRSSST